MTRLLITAILLACTAWGGYWFVGSGAQKSAIKGWMDDRADAGWVANYAEVSVQGFPNRFDSTITDLELADPQYGWSWSAPEFHLHQLSYQPNHVIAVWPNSQTLASPTGRVEIASADMRASVVFEPRSDLELARSTLTLDDVTLSRESGWTSAIENALLATRQSETEPFAHDIAFDASNFTPSAAIKSKLDPKGILPAQFDSFRLDTTAVFDGPWDLHAIEADKPSWTRLDIKTFDAQWGDLNIRAKGSVTLDREGYPSGKLELRARNWRQMLDLAVAGGSLAPDVADTIELGLDFIARLSGNENTLEVPLRFANRIMSLGPVPIGEAPQLRWR